MSEDTFQVLSCEHILQLNELKYTLKPSFRKYLNETIYSEQSTKNCYEIYVQYMAILSRQLLKSIKDWNQFELNQNILSSQVAKQDGGPWTEPESLERYMQFNMTDQDQEGRSMSKDQPIENPGEYFLAHEENFL